MCQSDSLLFLQSCSCNDAVIASADLIDWDQGSISCGKEAPLKSGLSAEAVYAS